MILFPILLSVYTHSKLFNTSQNKTLYFSKPVPTVDFVVNNSNKRVLQTIGNQITKREIELLVKIIKIINLVIEITCNAINCTLGVCINISRCV